jgi:hypothetical protein
MYPIDFESLLEKKEYLKKKILFFSCISFEERCQTAARLISDAINSDVVWGFFKLIDNGSFYEKECSDMQNEITNEISKSIKINRDNIPEYNLFDSQPWEDLIFYFQEIIEENPNINTIIVDVTTIPKVCYFPFLKWLIDRGLADRDLILCYTKPLEYGASEMESEPSSPGLLIGEFKSGKDIIWIPSLGFKSTFTKTILEKVREIDREVEKKIMPMIGFPAYRPDYYDKVLVLHVKEGDPELTESLKNPILAAADDPFDVYYKIMEIVDNYDDKDIILSPVGPKPMAIGLALAAIQRNLPVYAIQPRTYHPDYSVGQGSCSAFWIKRNGEYTF